MDDSSLRRRRSRREGDPEFDLGGELAVRSQERTMVAGSGDAAEGTAGESAQEVALTAAGDAMARENPVNPFWSERMQEEARLRAARPAFLNEAATGSEQTSASTELRAVEDAGGLPQAPQGPPQVLGPPDDTLAFGSVGRLGKGRGQSASSGEPPHGAATAPGSEVESNETAAAIQPPGLRPAERQILTQMKGLLEGLFEQNSSIVQRLEKLEEDNAMKSATSGGSHTLRDELQGAANAGEEQSSWHHPGKESSGSSLGRYVSGKERNAPDYLEGLQEGYRRAREEAKAVSRESLVSSPPSVGELLDVSGTPRPNRNRAVSPMPRTPEQLQKVESRVCTTPQGTPIPSGEPPRSPRQGQYRLSEGFEFSGCNHDELLKSGFSELSVPGNELYGDWGMDVGPELHAGLHGNFPAASEAPLVDPRDTPPSLPNQGGFGSTSNKDPYAPGDRVYWQLPTLEEPAADSDAATRASDWVHLLEPIMADLAPWSSLWWKRVLYEARSWYQRWCEAPASEKALIQPNVSRTLGDLKFRRLESRAFAMLQGAVPETVKQALVASRCSHCVGVLYHVYRLFQPGGLQERVRLLETLTNPGPSIAASEACSRLRAWHRALARAATMQVAIPDCSILLKGLDGVVSGILKRHPHVSFRCSSARHTLQLDHQPTLEKVKDYSKILLSECDMLAVSGEDTTPKGPKPPKVAKAEVDASSTNPQAKAKSSQPASSPTPTEGAKGKGKGKGKLEGQPCKFYLTEAGCNKGRACRAVHNFGQAKGESRCFNCGSTGHRQDKCERPTGPKGKGKEANPPWGESSSSNSSSSNANANASASIANASNANATAGTSVSASKAGSISSQPQGKGGTPQVAAMGSMPNGSGQGFSQTGPVAQSGADSTQVLVEECARILKGFRIAAFRAVDQVAHGSAGDHTSSEQEVDPESDDSLEGGISGGMLQHALRKCQAKPNGLLDGGATHALRQATEGELSLCRETRVNLAVGSAALRINPVGTVVTESSCAPIVPLGALIAELNCSVKWDHSSCEVTHPVRGVLPITMTSLCPEVPYQLAIDLIQELENHRACVMQRALYLRSLAVKSEAAQNIERDMNEDAGNVAALRWLQWLCPGAPVELLAAVPSCKRGEVRGEDLPFNRRVRRRVQRAQGVVLHLFSGQTSARELGHLPNGVFVLSVDINKGADLLGQELFQYLCQLCHSGKVWAVIGGPPCGTYSVCREMGKWDHGPRRIRAREGPERYGKEGLTAAERQQLWEANLLYMRFLYLYRLASVATEGNVLCVLEGPQDPSTYRNDCSDAASFFASTEVSRLKESEAMMVADFQQSGLGHEACKPTSVLTNSWYLYKQLHGIQGSKLDAKLSGELSARLAQTKTWSKWAPGLCRAIGGAIEHWIGSSQADRWIERDADHQTIRALSAKEAEFRDHCRRDHVVYRRDCAACLGGMMRTHQHLRNRHPQSNALVLSLDLIGPWKPGHDHMHEQTVRHVLVATLTVPVYTDGRSKLLTDPDGDVKDRDFPKGEEGDSERDLDPDLFAEEKAFRAEGEDELEDTEDGEDQDRAGEGESAEPEGDKSPGNKFWKDMRKQLTEPVLFAEPLASKRGSVVLQAVQRIYARIRLLNLSVRRVHSDQGREFTNRNFVAWATSRDIAITHSSPSDPKANGRVEAHINLVKGGVRTVMSTSPDLPISCWPHALRQWVAQRFERSMALLGGQLRSRPLVPYGTRVVVRKREWSRKSPFDAKTLHGVAVCPSERVHNATVVRLVDVQEDGTELVRLYTAPVAVQRVLQPVQFEGEEITEADCPLPPLPPPPNPPSTGRRRLKAKSAPVAEEETGRGAPRGESVVFDPEPEGPFEVDRDGVAAPVVAQLSSTTVADDARLRSVQKTADALDAPALDALHVISDCSGHEMPRKVDVAEENQERRESESFSEGASLVDVEAKAQQLLKKPWISKSEMNTLITQALRGKMLPENGRKVDRCSRAQGAKGLTLGFYVYGKNVGVTKQTTQHYYLTAAINKYLQQVVPDATWAALRVMESKGNTEPHRDSHNQKGSENISCPLNTYEKGRIWVEGSPENSEEEGLELQVEGLSGRKVVGRFVGGSEKVVRFDPGKWHCVEGTSELRRVVIAYTPRMIDQAEPVDRQMLAALNFPLPPKRLDASPPIESVVASSLSQPQSVVHQGSEQPQRYPKLQGNLESQRACACELIGVAGEHAEYLCRLREFVAEEQKAFTEEVQLGQGYATLAQATELQDKYTAAVLAEEHDHVLDSLSKGLNTGFWLRKLQAIEGIIRDFEGRGVYEDVSLCSAQIRDACEHDERGFVDDQGDESAKELGELPLTGEPPCHPRAKHPDFGLHSSYVDSKNAKPPENPATLLQTRVVSQQEVWEDIESWRIPLTEEVSALKVTHQAVRAITPPEILELEKTRVVMHIPSKGVFTEKAITNKKRARVVGCGNFMPSVRDEKAAGALGQARSQDLYASGMDGAAVRLQVRLAAARRWKAGTLDIKTAFLAAPLFQQQGLSSKATKKLESKAIIVTPPKILSSLGIIEPGEKWLVLKALYGLAEAPAAWATERDLQLSRMKWTDEHGSTFCLQQCQTDENLWKIIRWDPEGNRHVAGLAGIYVDDILFTGESEAVGGFVRAVQGIWTTSEPEFVQPGKSVRFCGFNLHGLESGGFLLNQEDYIRDLLLRYPHVVGTSEVPYLKEEEPPAEGPNLQTLRQAQAYGGAFQWLSCRSRPDIAYATNRIAQLMSKFPAYAVACSETLLKYLRRTCDFGLRFDPVENEAMFGESDQLGAPRQLALLEIFADASFAPSNQKSQTGVIATFGGAAVAWLSTRQSVVSLSTAEAELHSTIDGITLLHVLGPIIAELLEMPVRKLVYNDNVSCVTLFTAPSGAWRTRHLRLKAKAFREQLEDEQYELRHLVGRWMLGDLCTKPLQGQRLRELCQLLGMQGASQAVSAWGESDASDTKNTKNNANKTTSTKSKTESMVAGSAVAAVRALAAASCLQRVLGERDVLITVKVEDGRSESGDLLSLLKLAACVLALLGGLFLTWWLSRRNAPPEDLENVRAFRLPFEQASDWSVIDDGSIDSPSNHGYPRHEDAPPEEGLRRRHSRVEFRPRNPETSSGSRDNPTVVESLEGHEEGRAGSGGGLQSRLTAVQRHLENQGVARLYRDDVVAVGTPSSMDAVRAAVEGDEARPGEPRQAEHEEDTGVRTEREADTGERTEAVEMGSGRFSGERKVQVPSTDEVRATGDRPVPGSPRHSGALEETPIPLPYPGAKHSTSWVHPVMIHPTMQRPKQPPIFGRSPDPDWGGPAGNLHQIIPEGHVRDFWYCDRSRGVLVRFHAAPRTRLFDPSKATLPSDVPLQALTGRRRTLAMFQQPTVGAPIPPTKIEDSWDEAPSARPLAHRWKGRTELELQPGT